MRYPKGIITVDFIPFSSFNMASAAGLLSPGLVSLVKRAQNIRQEMDPGFLSSSENIFQSKSYSNYNPNHLSETISGVEVRCGKVRDHTIE